MAAPETNNASLIGTAEAGAGFGRVKEKAQVSPGAAQLLIVASGPHTPEPVKVAVPSALALLAPSAIANKLSKTNSAARFADEGTRDPRSLVTIAVLLFHRGRRRDSSTACA